MKKEAIDIQAIGGEICSLLGLAEGGWAGALGGGACELALKSIHGVINSGGNNKDDQQDTIYRTEVSYEYLANELKSLGCTSPIYTDPKKLMNFFISGHGGDLGARGFQNQIKLVNAIRNFVTAGAVIQQMYPTFINDAVKYVFDSYQNHAQDLNQTINDLNKLTEKAGDPKQSFYIISILRGNYEAAFLFNMLANFGNVDEKVYNNFAMVSKMATEMLGKQSQDVLNVRTLMDQRAIMNADLFAKRFETFNIMIPYEKQSLQVQQSIVDGCYPIVKQLLHNPLVEKFLPYIIMLGQLPHAAKYILGGGGEALNGGLN